MNEQNEIKNAEGSRFDNERCNFDAIITGAGPCGAVLALALAKKGLKIALIDKTDLKAKEDTACDGRAYALAADAAELLERTGVMKHLPRAACEMTEIRVADGRLGEPASPLYLHMSAEEAGVDSFGIMIDAPALSVAINLALAEEAATTGRISLFAPMNCEIRRTSEGVTALLANGLHVKAPLIMNAEGRRSTLRQSAGIPISKMPYGESALLYTIAHAEAHQNTALELFLPNGPFAQLPLSGSAEEPNLSCIVLCDKPEVAEHLSALSKEELALETKRRMGPYLGEVRVVSQTWVYPLAAQYAHRYISQRMILVGDSAHGVHPVAGQGLNLGYRDVIALEKLAEEAKMTGEDIGALPFLKRYQAATRPYNLSMLFGMHAIERLFSNDSRILRIGRDLGIAAVDRIPPFKNFFIKVAMGKTAQTKKSRAFRRKALPPLKGFYTE